jgi:tRNA nucleotidyltransferase (CCA-adding enzyme)
MDLRQEILKKVKPLLSEERKISNNVKKFIDKLNSKLENAKAIVGGSFAKGTWLKDNHDIDIFVLFDDDKDCSDILENVLKKCFTKIIRIHGSRDYFNVLKYNLNFEIVPIFKIEKCKDAKNITDISPLHVRWVRSKLNEELVDDIRIAKQFFKAQGIYGAETYIKGFSGYVIEILTIHYGSFDKLMKAGAKLKSGEWINIENVKADLNKDKLSPLIVVDPVQKERNAAAALSLEKFNRFISVCRAYIQKPTLSLFEIKSINLTDLKNKNIIIKAWPLEGTKDVIGTKLFICFERIKEYLIIEGYTITDSGWNWNKEALYWFNVKSKELSKYKEHQGPPLDKQENVESFKLKYIGKKIIEKEGRVYAIIPRKYTKLKNYVRHLIKTNEEIKKRVKKIKIV